MKALVFFFCVILLCPLVLQNWGSMAAQAEETPRLYIEMLESLNNTLHPGSIFHAAIQLCNVPVSLGVVGVEFLIWWDSAIRALNMTEVMFHELTPESEVSNIGEVHTIFSDGVSDTSVYYYYTFINLTRALDGGYAPISGNHTLAIVTFEAVIPGDAEFYISVSNLYDLNGQLVPHEMIGSFLPISAWEYLEIPNLTMGEFSIDGVMDEVAWEHAFHIHGSQHCDFLNRPYGRDVIYDLYLIASKKSLFVGVKISNSDFWTDGWLADTLYVEINDRNGGGFSQGVEYLANYSGNNLRELRATWSGLYIDSYFAGYVNSDPTPDGQGNYTFTGPRENGAAGNYCYEMEIPFNVSDSHDAVLTDGKPFSMVISYDDYQPPTISYDVVEGQSLTMIARSFVLKPIADLNGDYSVDIFDALTLAGAFGKNAGQMGYNGMADLNGDGTIDIFDAIIMSMNFNGS